MLTKKHPDACCPYCGSPLFHGLKTEPTGWKVQYVCPPPDGCDREFSIGRIDRSSVESQDEAYERGAKLGRLFV